MAGGVDAQAAGQGGGSEGRRGGAGMHETGHGLVVYRGLIMEEEKALKLLSFCHQTSKTNVTMVHMEPGSFILYGSFGKSGSKTLKCGSESYKQQFCRTKNWVY